MKLNLIIAILAIFASFLTGCGKSDKQTTDNKDDKHQTTEEKKNSSQRTLQASENDKSVEIQCSGMTCTGCENSLKSKVKKVDGVKDVIADHKTNVVKASYDPAKTNVDAIKNAISDAGFDVKSVK